MSEPRSIPDYPHQRHGTAIVCGSAWCLMEDYAEASRLRPGAFVIVVNRAGRWVKGDALFSLHYERMAWFIRDHVKAWGARPETHTACNPSAGKLAWVAGNGGVNCDYIWPQARSSGSSGWCAARLAKLMGHSEVILCGVPLTEGTYYGDDRPGSHQTWLRKSTARTHSEYFRLDSDWHAGVYSMSGFTREVLGPPAAAAAAA